MTKELLIVFIKNKKAGKVKTRLAKTIGKQAALEIYEIFLKITEKTVSELEIDKRIYFSEYIEETPWNSFDKAVQKGNDLGERMLHAFKEGFDDGYEKIIIIGSDLPDISSKVINCAFKKLEENDAVFGPAEDGGYYLLGLSKLISSVFKNKPWSESHLLEETLNELKENSFDFSTLETLNDIDTFEDLVASKFYQSNRELQTKLKQFHDQNN